MKTLVHTDKELIEATIKKCDICYVGLELHGHSS